MRRCALATSSRRAHFCVDGTGEVSDLPGQRQTGDRVNQRRRGQHRQRCTGGSYLCAENPSGLRDAVLQLYESTEEERSAMGKCGAEYAENNFDREKLFDQLEGTLASVAGES